MYEEITIRRTRGITANFPIAIGLHQEPALSPYLFTLVLDVLTEHIQESVHNSRIRNTMSKPEEDKS
ncbi:hypothetical protein CR513_07411, partial [Mucuna pruriens]